MIYKTFKEDKISQLGFGTMRLPLDSQGEIDEKQVFDMVDMAIAGGINYFDTAYPYHSGDSERVVGRALARYPRESFFLATKYPGHQISDTYNPSEIFEQQLKKCRVDYFDYYLLHNVYEQSINVYTDEKWGILEYFKKEKELGRIRHLGFSTHGHLDTVKHFIEYCDNAGCPMEFCQIQLNYLDWTLQQGKEKCDYLSSVNIPVWVMEPIRGGSLTKAAPASSALRFLEDVPGVTVILSGMSDVAQMQDNISTFKSENPLSPSEKEELLRIAETMKDSLPCTACRYCCDGCPVGLDIPKFIAALNELRVSDSMFVGMRFDATPADKLPSACIGCGRCTKICPQAIDIPAALAQLSEKLAALPSWEEVCQKRALEQR